MGWEAALNRFLILHLWFTEKLNRPGAVSFGPNPVPRGTLVAVSASIDACALTKGTSLPTCVLLRPPEG